jgi:hypothetical protein
MGTGRHQEIHHPVGVRDGSRLQALLEHGEKRLLAHVRVELSHLGAGPGEDEERPGKAEADHVGDPMGR